MARMYVFSEDVRRVLIEARRAAARLGHEYVGTEHLLLGLLGAAGEALAPFLLGRRPAAMAAAVERRVPPGDPAAVGREDLPYTSRAKHTLELATDEARRLGHDGLRPEHLLLGLLREEGGVGGQALREAGLELEASRIAVAAASAVASLPRRPTLARRLLVRFGHWARRGGRA